ncbi:MAG: rod shape-determining protein [Candidatus Tectomicrobia bacterium]|uniref:Cell shape-determining protein MreB n=1 Tax=Tectimicrobiota bacterium TaxID=2528274 RepID=A0A932HZV9_UNCTE|nr:rod shape-determining protein [Candidatus Tectomicrobia bacterium]
MWLLDRFSGLMGQKLAMDLGTANTLIYREGGIVLDEPSVVALSSRNGGSVLAVGKRAKEMYGRTPESIRTIRPMKDGVIADFDVTKAMISHFIKATMPRRRLGRPTMMICVPAGITSVEMKAVIDSASQCGAGKVHLIEEPMAAAIGSKLPIHEIAGSMVIDIGGGTTEVAVISQYTVAYSESLRVAGDAMDDCIQRYVRREHGLAIGSFEAERVKIEIGSAAPLSEPMEAEVCGSDVSTGIPRVIKLTDGMVRASLEPPVKAIVEAIRKALSKTSPELAADIQRRGIVLAGGGALLKGLGARLHTETGLPIYRVKDPLTAVVRGTGHVLDHFKELKQVCLN